MEGGGERERERERETHHASCEDTTKLMTSSRVSEAFNCDKSWELFQSKQNRGVTCTDCWRANMMIKKNDDDWSSKIRSSMYNACLGPAGCFCNLSTVHNGINHHYLMVLPRKACQPAGAGNAQHLIGAGLGRNFLQVVNEAVYATIKKSQNALWDNKDWWVYSIKGKTTFYFVRIHVQNKRQRKCQCCQKACKKLRLGLIASLKQ